MDTTPLQPDFRELLELLNAKGVRYLLVGAYAVGLHGHCRGTSDMDVWVEPERENAKRVLETLSEFGFGELELSVEDLVAPDTVVQLGYPPVRIDLLTGILGVEFSGAYARHEIRDLAGVPVSVIGLEDLKASKRAAGRHKDLDDLEHLG